MDKPSDAESPAMCWNTRCNGSMATEIRNERPMNYYFYAQRKSLLGFASGIALLGAVSVSAQQYSAWSTPVNMGPSINTVHTEWHAAISADLLTIFFISDRPGGLGGTDLWVAQRPTRNADWAPAQNLGATINTSGDEFTPELSPDGHWLFFS